MEKVDGSRSTTEVCTGAGLCDARGVVQGRGTSLAPEKVTLSVHGAKGGASSHGIASASGIAGGGPVRSLARDCRVGEAVDEVSPTPL